MTIEPVRHPAQPGPGEIFTDCQGLKVANAPFGQIARIGMMNIVRRAPITIGGPGEYTEKPPDPIIGFAVFEKRLMTAIMLDDEQPYDKSTGGQYQ